MSFSVTSTGVITQVNDNVQSVTAIASGGVGFLDLTVASSASYSAGSYVELTGTTSYNDAYLVDSIPDSTTIRIPDVGIAGFTKAFGSTETGTIGIGDIEPTGIIGLTDVTTDTDSVYTRITIAATTRLVVNGLLKSNEVYPVRNPTTGGGGIDVVWRSQVYIAETGVSGLTASESSKLLSLDTDTINGLIEDVSGDRFTAKALEQAPSGGGGGEAKEDIYDYFTTSNREDVFKADITGLETKVQADARQVDLKGTSDRDLTEVFDNTPSVNLGTMPADVLAIKSKTDSLNFTGDDVQSIASNMRGTDSANTVTPDNSGIAAIESAVDNLNDFNPATDTVANVTTVANMRGTDGANTVAPDNSTIAAIAAAIIGLNNLSSTDVTNAVPSVTDIINEINSSLDIPASELVAIGEQVRIELAAELSRMDVEISSRSTLAEIVSSPDLFNHIWTGGQLS